MGFHKEFNCADSQLLNEVECPCCKAKGTLRYFNHADIPALNQTVVCDLCGGAFLGIGVNEVGQVVYSAMVGFWKQQVYCTASVSGDETIERGSVYFEPLKEPKIFQAE